MACYGTDPNIGAFVHLNELQGHTRLGNTRIYSVSISKLNMKSYFHLSLQACKKHLITFSPQNRGNHRNNHGR